MFDPLPPEVAARGEPIPLDRGTIEIYADDRLAYELETGPLCHAREIARDLARDQLGAVIRVFEDGVLAEQVWQDPAQYEEPDNADP